MRAPDRATPTHHPALEALGVSKVFGDGTRALDGADLRVDVRRTVALLGESGCGKSTLLRLFNGTVRADDGEVRVDGEPLREEGLIDLRRRIGYVPQHGGLLPHWSVERNVGLVPALLRWPAGRRRERVDEVLDLVGLRPDTYRARHPLELSGGQRQRVAFARALAADPKIVLLDEPFGALDAITRLELQLEFARLQRNLEKSVLLVTHDLDEAFRLGDTIAVMRDGRVLQADSADRISSSPADPYVERLLALRSGAGSGSR